MVPTEGEADRRLPRSRRLTASAEIRAIVGRGKRSRTAHLDVFDSASPVPYSRVGIIVPKHGRRIVDRNRLKRRLREILRQEMLPWLSGRGSAMDVLVRARREAYTATYDELRQELIAWQSRR